MSTLARRAREAAELNADRPEVAEILHAAADRLAMYDIDDDDPVGSEHFHGCPTPTGRPFDCDWCQQRAAGMAE